jgi:hypothetical protein
MGGVLKALHFAPKAKRVIYLFMSGGPSHIDLFDYKPKLNDHRGQDLPASVRMGQRITGMTSGQKTLPVAPSIFKFKQHGKAGTWVSELLPNIATIADEMAVVKSMNTEAINHDPAFTYIQTGSQQPGRPSLGAWLSYGIGSENKDLPAFVVLISQGSGNKTDQPIFTRLWGSGFLPTQHQGVRLRSQGDPVLYLSNPDGVDADGRRKMLDAVGELNKLAQDKFGDPEIATLIEDLEARGTLDTTMVVALGEFGRTPKISTLSGQTKPGRDHWSSAMSILFAGCETPGGQVVGATDRNGYAASERVLSPENFVSTIYRKLGIDPGKIYHTPQGRPVHLVSDATPISELMA